MISPYVRKLRLATELRNLRIRAGLTHEQLSKLSGESKPQLSRMENGHVVDQASVLQILQALEVTDEEWIRIMTIAREAGEKGWWESVRGVGARQAVLADLEAGATSIRQYSFTSLPDLLQIPEYVRVRSVAEERFESVRHSTKGIEAGRIRRSHMLHRPGGPTYELILDEVAIHRPSAPPDVFRDQLLHLTGGPGSDPQIRLRVLPLGARVTSYAVPRCTFSLYTYPDPGDPLVVVVEMVSADQVITEQADTAPYELQYNDLLDAALSQDESLELLAEAAARLAGS